MNWLMKAAIQKGLSFVPYSHKLNFYLQRYITVGKHLPEDFVTDRLFHLQRHVQFARQYGDKPLNELKAVEIGTGWYPVVPIGLFLAGFDHIITCDVKALYNSTSFNQTLTALQKLHEKGKLNEYIPNFHEERLKELNSAFDCPKPGEKFRFFNITPLMGDTRTLDLEDASQDFILSNNTLQVIPLKFIKGVIREMARITKPGGIMSHSIDLSDQYAIYDQKLSSYNYLKYSEKSWNLLFNNKHQHQNRQRLPFFRNLLSKNSFEVIKELWDDEGNVKELNQIKLAEQFRGYDTKETAVRQMHMVVRKCQDE